MPALRSLFTVVALLPGLLILYHQLFFGASEEKLLSEVRSRYNGRMVSAHDLEVY
jgi:hypothetical protein